MKMSENAYLYWEPRANGLGWLASWFSRTAALWTRGVFTAGIHRGGGDERSRFSLVA